MSRFSVTPSEHVRLSPESKKEFRENEALRLGLQYYQTRVRIAVGDHLTTRTSQRLVLIKLQTFVTLYCPFARTVSVIAMRMCRNAHRRHLRSP
jgi:hypothetical protein